MNLSEENQIGYIREYMTSGIRRSLIRRIGSHLPLSSTQRPRFELLPNGARLIGEEQKPIFSLSDVCQLVDIPDMFPKSKSCGSLNAVVVENNSEDQANSLSIMTSSSTTSLPQEEVASKISALEDELSLLRSQIAMLVSNQNRPTENPSNLSMSFNSTVTGASEPFSCSTPIKSIPPPPPPCMAPPPPPPLLLTLPQQPANNGQSVIELIRERKRNKHGDSGVTQPNPPKAPISMSDVLKDLHKVKLKSVSRSPGGTPMNSKKKPHTADPSDPAAFIAAALRKKFSHHSHYDDSPDKSPNLGLRRTQTQIQSDKEWGESPPKFGQHLLKKRSSLSKVPAS